MGIWLYKLIAFPLIVFLLGSTSCSGCEDAVEEVASVEPEEPWDLQEGTICAFETPDEAFVQISENTWSRVLPVVHQGCGDYQANLEIYKLDAEKWTLTVRSRICNRCAERRFVRGRGQGSELVSGAVGFVGVLDEQQRRYMFGCGYPLYSLIESPSRTYQIEIAPEMMHQMTMQIRFQGIHPKRLPNYFPFSSPYYNNPTDFSSDLDLVTEWPYLRTATDRDSTVAVDVVEVLCAEFFEEGAPYERALQSRETYYFEHVIDELGFPAEFEAFLHSRDFAD